MKVVKRYKITVIRYASVKYVMYNMMIVKLLFGMSKVANRVNPKSFITRKTHFFLPFFFFLHLC